MNACFECDGPAEEQHHVIPRVRGGRRTVGLCSRCHGKVHDLKRNDMHRQLTLEGLAKARAQGIVGGRRPTYSPEVIAEVKRLRAEGHTTRAVAKIMGMSASRVGQLSREESKKLSMAEIAKLTGMSTTHVFRILHKKEAA